MIGNVLKLLGSNDFFNESKEIEIAKGKYKIPKTIEQSMDQFKRDLKWQKRK